ncbi:uncharacterized protein EI97DRAFT_190643 [Westerdykella ornata]|uniref:Nuclear pore complex subunit Nup192 n=1 Tax=Westerdykella ornata TaxID=318751 RepID=A0A6A6J992_WESOR|nr:uncharacterized protein EI97DRAFT_190643 [Westerdykella ornata]KAF2273141.1 hypothetical protein EI97DRAFT_190643 [Westerdykella ornata]
MAADDSLAGLQALHRDLCSLIELKLPVLDRLVVNLEARLDELRALLEKKPKNDASRKTLTSGQIKIGEEEYSVNDEFKQRTIELADFLDLDELDAAALFMGAENEAKDLDRSQEQTAIIRFHRRREYALLCIRLMTKAALEDVDTELVGFEVLLKAVQIIIGAEGEVNTAYKFWARCLAAMESIENWLQLIFERLQSAQVVGQVPVSGLAEIMTFQRQSLTRQHESLAAICTHMIKQNFANRDNFNALLSRVKTLERHDIITIHYVPMVMRLTSWVAQESNTPTRDARPLHKTLMAGRESENWPLRSFHSSILAWWLAEYSGRYMDPNPHDLDLQGVDFDEEANARSEAFLTMLNDGAFHFMLSVGQDMRPTRWYDPTKTSMISSLLQDTAVLSSEVAPPEDSFKELVMDQLQTFVDAFITNMPDTLRRLKAEEDDQRRRLQLSFHRTAADQPLHLERFLLIVSYAYDGAPGAAEYFWSDKESNLYGFLQWAAKRQPTPRIAMFCEMLRSISTGQSNADSAHNFLLEEGVSTSGKIRRTSSLSYTHIFNELLEFQSSIHEPKKTIQGALYAPTNPVDDIVEPETATMLQSYLRLISHLCRESPGARSWMLSDQVEYNIVGICFSLCTDKVDSPIRAAAFDVISSLLVDKTPSSATAVWNNLEEWAVSGFYVGSKQPNPIGELPREELWTTLANGYGESLAFIRLLHSLMEPYQDNLGLNDSLPFPEGLGSTRRMPGVHKFIDFVMHEVFAERSPEIPDTLQRNVMRWTCLRFITVCLSTFNENLVVLANKSSIDVDSVIDSSSLRAYVTLHPFARVMEWLFNDKVLRALFASSHHDVDEVDAAPSDSPLVQSLMLSIEVMDLVMKLQATYLDIVKPIIKQQNSLQHLQIGNVSLASFEDAVLTNLQLIVDLGHYCGTGHETLTIASLHLLEKLASSRKLAVSPAGFGQRSGRSKIVGIMEKDNEAERIGRNLADLMQYREEELEAGPEASGYILKLRVLEFLRSCLVAVTNRPTIAHILLGLTCDGTTVRVAEESLWTNNKSLFHSILILAASYPDIEGGSFVAWRSEVKAKCWDVLQKLWSSPLTSAVVMEELRLNELLFVQAPELTTVNLDTLWDGLPLAVGIQEQAEKKPLSMFFGGAPAAAMQNFLQIRAAFLDYASRELRLANKEGLPTVKSRIQSFLLGITLIPGPDALRNPSIFELFDFIEFNIPERMLPDPNAVELLQGVDLAMCKEEKQGLVLFSLPLLEQLFLLKLKIWRKMKANEMATEGREVIPKTTADPKTAAEQEMAMLRTADELMTVFADYNRRAQLVHYHKDILRSWVQLMRIAIEVCDFEATARTNFIIQTFQTILPKLELSYNNDIFTALQLSSLAEALLQKVEFDANAFSKSKTGDFSNDRLSQLFRAGLIGIYCPVSNVELREYCYQIAFRYIHATFAAATKGSSLGRHTLNTVKHCGRHLLEVICDDAYSGQGSCKVSALLLLTALVAMATRQESKYILETFMSLNLIGVLVDNIKHIPDELRAAAAPQVSLLLTYYDCSLSLLLRICQTRLGASYVLNAGLFHSIRESNLFSVDPDIGLGISSSFSSSALD